ncbi:MAG: ABC transporter ATP-binding protein [Lachnospiraceae bacterium]|nr:ABC transporter ATP-binding protein [Lachnospiraceae bacterium]
MEAALQVRDLCKTYVTNKRQNNVLKNVTFTVEKGEMVAVMGPSGSGKSTLLYCVSGMDRPTAGEVLLGEQKITGLSEKNLAEARLHEMGFIFQQMHMLKNLTILDNIVLPAYQAGKRNRTRQEMDEYGRSLMRKFEISEIADRDIMEVSGGQLQRACICRSLINHPEILFADEPTGALNRGSSDEVMRELNRCNADGMTILLVTHDMKVASKCSRILYIVDGNIEGELSLGMLPQKTGEVLEETPVFRERERKVNCWLNDLGW